MPSTDVILPPWSEANVAWLKQLYDDGKSFAQIAAIMGQGITRNAALGKAKRIGLPPREHNRLGPKPHGNKGQSTAKGIVARTEKRQRAVARATVQHMRSDPFREGNLPLEEEGADVTGYIGSEHLTLEHGAPAECRWIAGEPTAHALYCGKPVKEGSSWCPDHYARVYPARG